MINMRGGGNEDNKRNSSNAQGDNDREKGEGAIEGSNKPDKLFHSSGSDSDGGKDNEMEGGKKDKDLLLTKQDISTTEKKQNRERI